jgi:hypothetical protein
VAYTATGNKLGALEEYRTLKTLDPRLADEFYQRFVKK